MKSKKAIEQRRGRDVHGGGYYEIGPDGLERADPGPPTVVVCRRVADFAPSPVPPGAAFGHCARCHAPIAFNPAAPHQDVPRVCLQCAEIEPRPIES